MKIQRIIYFSSAVLFLGLGIFFIYYAEFVQPNSIQADWLWDIFWDTNGFYPDGFILIGIVSTALYFFSEKIYLWLGSKTILLTSLIIFLPSYFYSDFFSYSLAKIFDLGEALALSLFLFAVLELWCRKEFSMRKASFYLLLITSFFYLFQGIFLIGENFAFYYFNLDIFFTNYAQEISYLLHNNWFPNLSLPFLKFISPNLSFAGWYPEDLNTLVPLIIGFAGLFGIDRKNKTLKHLWIWYGIGLYLLLPALVYKYARSIPTIIILCLIYAAIFILRPTSVNKSTVSPPL